MNTPKVVSGIDAASLAAVQAFYDPLVERTVPVSRPREAELTKLLENTFRHVNIALVNELAMFAGDLGIDVWEAIDAASTKPFGYMRFTPGPGVGGHCLPIDPSYLSWRVQRIARPAASGSSSWPTTSTSTCPTTSCAASWSRLNAAAQAGQRQPHPAARPGVQDEHRRRARVARRSAWPSGSSPSAPTCVAADPHVRPSTSPTADRARRAPPEEEVAAADAVVLLADHDAFDFEMIVGGGHARARHPAPPPCGTEGRVPLESWPVTAREGLSPWPRTA